MGGPECEPVEDQWSVVCTPCETQTGLLEVPRLCETVPTAFDEFAVLESSVATVLLELHFLLETDLERERLS